MSIADYINTITLEPVDKYLLIDELWRDYDIDFNSLSDDELEDYKAVS